MEKNIKIYLLTLFYLLLIFSCKHINPLKYIDPLYKYEKAWQKENISFFIKKINTFPESNFNDVYNADIRMSDVSSIFYVGRDFFKRVKYINKYEKYIKSNSYFFWMQFFKNEKIFKINKPILLGDFFIYDRYYTEKEKDSIIKICNILFSTDK
jgi:hypothetical protein